MPALLKRLVASSAAYQAASLLSSAIAVVTLPLYTHHVGTGSYGYADVILVAVILTSIGLRLGLGEAIVRWWFDDDDAQRRLRLARDVTGVVFVLSTAVALLARGSHVACLWAGDSRAYRIRGKRIERMTQDHAMVEDLVSSGLMSRDEAMSHPQANRITRAIGAMPGLFVDVEIFALEPGDIFLLCSDGLYKELNDADIVKTLNGNEQSVDALINLALERRARDNVTVVAVRFTA